MVTFAPSQPTTTRRTARIKGCPGVTDAPIHSGTTDYHDHAIGITRTNAYAGIASALLIIDDFEIGLV